MSKEDSEYHQTRAMCLNLLCNRSVCGNAAKIDGFGPPYLAAFPPSSAKACGLRGCPALVLVRLFSCLKL
jgi:hypothetical protein